MVTPHKKILISSIVVVVVVFLAIGIICWWFLYGRLLHPPPNPGIYGCNTTTWTCEPGRGGMTKGACAAKCHNPTPTQIAYGCNPQTGQCELGLGTKDQDTCTCEKQTYQCDESSWTCNDTPYITGTTKDNCGCTPELRVGYMNPSTVDPIKCTQDSDCPHAVPGVDWTCQKDGFCGVDTPIKCSDVGGGYGPDTGVAAGCDNLFANDIPGLSADKLCQQITDARKCQQTSFASNCTDQNNKIWSTDQAQCGAFPK